MNQRFAAIQTDTVLLGGGLCFVIIHANSFTRHKAIVAPAQGPRGGVLANARTIVLAVLAFLAAGGTCVAQFPKAGQTINPTSATVESDKRLSRHAGDLDPTFGSKGVVIASLSDQGRPGEARSQIRALVIQPDGKIVVAGLGQRSGTNNDFAVARFNLDGDLDGEFGAGGKALTDFGGQDLATGVALQADGKIVAVGYSEQTATGWDIAIARYNRDGTLDHSFGKEGKVLTDFTPAGTRNDYAHGVALQPDGKIVIAGRSGPFGRNVPYDFAVLRYNHDGTLDRTFGVDGKVLTDFAVDGYSIVRLSARLFLGRTGRILTSFLPFGVSHDEAHALSLQPDGKIVAAGSSVQRLTGWDFAVARYNRDGTLDDGSTKDTTPGDSFGLDGKVVTDLYPPQLVPDEKLSLSQQWSVTRIGTGHDQGFALAVQADGKVVVAGGASAVKSDMMFNDFAMVRYNRDGTLDHRFGRNGKVLTEFGHTNNGAIIYDLALQSDGKLVAAGTSDQPDKGLHFALARYNRDGSLDQGFGTAGKVISALGASRSHGDSASSVALQSDGKILVGGHTYTSFALGSESVLARYEAGNLLERNAKSARPINGNESRDPLGRSPVPR
jgi:uncharacterized delta-60 repeat protein